MITKPRHRDDTTVYCNAVSRVDNAMTCHCTGYDRCDIRMLAIQMRWQKLVTCNIYLHVWSHLILDSILHLIAVDVIGTSAIHCQMASKIITKKNKETKKRIVDTRSCPLDRTASLSLYSFTAILAPGSSGALWHYPRRWPPRVRLRVQPTSVCLHTSHLIKRETCCGTTVPHLVSLLTYDNNKIQYPGTT